MKNDQPESHDAEGEAIHSLSEHIDHNIESMVEVQRSAGSAIRPGPHNCWWKN
jgi:hypothetical protein